MTNLTLPTPRFKRDDYTTIQSRYDPFNGHLVKIEGVRPVEYWATTTEPVYRVTVIQKKITFNISDSELGPSAKS